MKRFDMGQEITFCGRTMLMGELLSLAKETLDRRAQKKPLPESKPEPCDENAPCWVGDCPHKVDGFCHAEQHEKTRRKLQNEHKPDKNCGNCAHNTKYPNPNCEGTGCKNTGYSLWQPKPAEAKAEGWEQRLKKVFDNASFDTDGHMDSEVYRRIEAFIRAEIDSAWGDGFKAGHDIAEENRSNE